MRKVRFGILGDARINRRLIPAIQAARNAELVAIASRSVEKARAAAASAGISTAHGSYADLIANPDIDAVYIPLPNHLHAEWTMKAADAGKHVLCEKPLGISAAQAQQMVDHCRARSVRLLDGFMWPHHARTAALRRLIDSGQLGDVRRLTASFTFVMDLAADNVRLHADMGGGSLLDVGCYPIYFARWVFQAEPTRVCAAAEMKNFIDLRMDGLLEFPGGRTALFDCGFTLPYRIGVEIVGTKARLLVPQMWLPPERASYQIIYDEDDRRETFTLPADDQVVNLVEEFARAVLEERAPRPLISEAVKTLRVLDALSLSARKGSPVTLEP